MINSAFLLEHPMNSVYNNNNLVKTGYLYIR